MSYVAAAIGGSALVGAGASIFSGLEQSSAAGKASQAQVGEEQQALALQQQQLQTLNPWINVGSGANYTLGSLYGIGANGQGANGPGNYAAFFNSPDYQFAQQQGQAGLQNYENANGLAKSGAGLAAASTFNQGLATQQFGNYYNRLMGLSTLGEQAAGAGVGGANAAAQTIGSIGQSQASGIVGSASALAGGATGTASALSGGANNFMLSQLLAARNGSPSSFPSSTVGIGQTGTG
jgi:hypothetical protein